MLSVRGATVRYGAVTAVDGVDLEVPDGCVLALLGPSGCGKSTLLRAVAGLEPVVSGTVCWDGMDLARIPVHRRGFGLMFQDGVLFPHRTVAGNVAYGLRGQANVRSRVSELLDLVGLAGYDARRVVTLSGGEAQRVALARALAPRPRLLLLDEPLAALDRALREQLLVDLRTALTTTGTTSIFVTHDQGEAFAIADRVAVMRAGRIVQAGEPRAVWTHPVDEWTARFLGCSSVIRARPKRGPDGTWRSVTAFGSVAGRAEQVGLRPSALVVDPEGPIRGAVTSVVAGPDQQRAGVRLPRGDFADSGEVPGGDESAGGDKCSAGDDGSAGDEVQAVAHPSEALAVGQIVRLRWDPDGVALIGSSDEVSDSPAEPSGPAELVVARRLADTPGS